MNIGLIRRHPWFDAAGVPGVPGALGYRVTELFDGHPPSPGTPADLAKRAEWGASVLAVAEADRPEVLLDCNGEGLLFVTDPSGISDFEPLHERLAVSLASHFHLPICEALGAMHWGHVWACLQSKTWIKACADPAQVAELQAFGVPNVVFLSAAAADADYPTEPLPLTPDGPPIGCPAIEHGSFFDSPNHVEPAMLVPGILAQSAVAHEPTSTFFNIYFNLYEIEPLIDASADPATTARAAQRYYAAKGYYTAQLGIARHARFVRFLSMRLGEQMRLFGTIEADGSVTDDTSVEQRTRMYRSVAINLGLGFNRAEHAPDGRLFEIAAAGGFLLAHAATGIADFLEPGVECDVFTGESDLLEKIQYYLDQPKRRVAIAAAGQRRVLEAHLYSHRLATLLRHGARTCSADPSPKRERGVHRPVACAPGSDWWGTLADADGPPGRLLVLQNPGRMSRFWLEGIERGATQLGIETRVLELGEIWQKTGVSQQALTERIADLVKQEGIVAAIGYTQNGCLDLPLIRDEAGNARSLFDRLGVPHLMFWSDHPHWANERMALRTENQPFLRSPNNHHFLKSPAAADEIRDLLGWANVHDLPVAEDVERLRPKTGVSPDFDVVAIVGSPPLLADDLEPMLSQDEPDVDAIHSVVAQRVATMLEAVWTQDAPEMIRPKLETLGEDWIEARRREPLRASYRHFIALSTEHPDAAEWLREHCETYFRALEAMWEFGRWQRTFVIRYLARFFHVGVFGNDWSSVGLGGDGQWVNYPDQPDVYARGKVALSISQCGDEEGMAHKPFEITACGAPCLHINRLAVADQFEPGVEIELFDTPAQAREKVTRLLADDDYRSSLAHAGRRRTQRDHAWSTRVAQMLERAGLTPARFGLTDWSNRTPADQSDAGHTLQPVA